MTTIRLQEWSEQLNVDMSFDQVDALRRVSGNALQITPGSRRDQWNLNANNYVGAIRVGDLSVLIRPKIPLENLFYMLSVGQSDIDFGSSLFGFEEQDLMPALAGFYERLLASTLTRGVLRSYREFDETLIAIRGRIDVPAILHSGGMPAPVPCRFDELSIDIAENQILWTAAMAMANYPAVDPAVRRNLRRTVGVLDGVAGVDPRSIPPVTLTRINRHYEPALRLAEVILGAGGIKDRIGGLEASTFLIDMNRLFERFVTTQLRRHLAGKLEVRDQVHTYLAMGQKISMYPDLVFYRKGESVLVADIKYKLTDNGMASNGDYYQLLAYCQATGVGKGVLIYSDVEKDLTSSATVMKDGPTLIVELADLRGDRVRVDETMARLALALNSHVEPSRRRRVVS